MNNELMRDIAELRRNMPRNTTAMRICDALEAELVAKQHSNMADAIVATQANANGGFDRKAYQRNYMRQRRAKKEASPQ